MLPLLASSLRMDNKGRVSSGEGMTQKTARKLSAISP